MDLQNTVIKTDKEEREHIVSSLLRVGFVGLGAIGYPMASRVIDRYPLRVFDISKERTQLLIDKGAEEAADLAALARQSNVVLIMVATPDQLLDALRGEHGLLKGAHPGLIIVVMSTVGVNAVEIAAKECLDAGVEIVDAPVSGGVANAKIGKLTIFIGGSKDNAETIYDLLNVMGTKLVDCGEKAGDGQSMKLVNQLMCSVNLVGSAECLAFAQSLGLDPQKALAAIKDGAAASFMLSDRGPRMVNPGGEITSVIDIFVKDSSLVSDAADLVNFDVPLLRAAAARFQMAQSMGLGKADDSAVFQTYVAEDTE